MVPSHPSAVGSSLPPVGGWIPWDELENELEHELEHDYQLQHEHDGTTPALPVEGSTDRRLDSLTLSPSVLVLPPVPNIRHGAPAVVTIDAMRPPLFDGTARNRDGAERHRRRSGEGRHQPTAKHTVFTSPSKSTQRDAEVAEITATPEQTAAAASQMLHIVADAESPLRWSPSPERLSHLRARDALASPGSPNRRRTSFSTSLSVCVSPTGDLHHHHSFEPEPEPEPPPEPPPAVRSSLALALAPALAPALTPAAREMQRVALRARRLARIQAQCAKAAGTSSSKYYTDAAVLHRLELAEQPAVVAALDSIWEAANTDARDRIIDRSEYLMMHRKITLALDPTIKPRDFKQAVREEWKEDSEGKKGLDRERFDWCWFELADMWTDTMEAEEYARFLN